MRKPRNSVARVVREPKFRQRGGRCSGAGGGGGGHRRFQKFGHRRLHSQMSP
jgi:hypothetical protein